MPAAGSVGDSGCSPGQEALLHPKPVSRIDGPLIQQELIDLCLQVGAIEEGLSTVSGVLMGAEDLDRPSWT